MKISFGIKKPIVALLYRFFNWFDDLSPDSQGCVVLVFVLPFMVSLILAFPLEAVDTRNIPFSWFLYFSQVWVVFKFSLYIYGGIGCLILLCLCIDRLIAWFKNWVIENHNKFSDQ
jgi:hypothetical protein